MPFLCPGVRACRQTSPQNFCLCVAFFFFSWRCVYGSGSASNNPLIVCHIQTPQFLGCVSVFFFFLQLLLHVGAHVSVSVPLVSGFYFIIFCFFFRIYSASANDLVCVRNAGLKGFTALPNGAFSLLSIHVTVW